ncbi:MAG TPA: ABC transporter substrate-binding protein [Acidimicrobiales bacterium]|nr:ABC transporter substrate-binding protein [Acidimicrobiales bacterium]
MGTVRVGRHGFRGDGFRRLAFAGAAALAAGGLVGGLVAPGLASAAGKQTIVIGSTNFEEQTIVANLYGDVLQHAGYPVKVEPSLGTRSIVVPAIEQGQIDLEPDYAGSLVNFLAGNNASLPAATQLKTAIPYLKSHLAQYGVTVLNAAPALDTNVFAVTKATAKKYHLTTLSSLKPVASKLTLGGPAECPTNAGCLVGLEKTYGLHFAGFKSLDEAGPLSVAALKNNQVQVVELFSSDGNVVSNDFVALKDDKHLEGATYIIPVIRKSVATKGVVAALNKLSAKLTTDQISKLNILVTGPKKEQPATVAKAWLQQQGLL